MAKTVITVPSALPSNVKGYEADLDVADLEIDPRIQRAYIRMDRVEKMKREFNPLALGRIHVSYRKDHSYRVLDGWHRLITVRELTSNAGAIPAFVYEGLTLEQEAQMFLQLNSGERPTAIDRYNVSLFAGDEESLAIDAIVHGLGWKVAATSGQGQLSCVKTLQQLYRRSVQFEEEPNLVHMALLMVNKAWGDTSDSAQAHILMGLGRVWQEYKDKLKFDRMVVTLRDIEGGPSGLTVAAKQIATLKRRKLGMAVAEYVVDQYNVRLGPRSALPQWSKRA